MRLTALLLAIMLLLCSLPALALSYDDTTIAAPEPVKDWQPGFRVLLKGDAGDDVLALQFRLWMLGFYIDDIDGEYGARVQTAVKLFQSGCGLEVTGIADAETAARLWAVDAPQTEFSRMDDLMAAPILPGDAGIGVAAMQSRLYVLGFMDEISGAWNDDTVRAVEAFRTWARLDDPDGAGEGADAAMLAALYTADLPIHEKTRLPLRTIEVRGGEAMRMGDAGEDVLRLQQRLAELGFYLYEPTGQYGDRTRVAVVLFQNWAGVTISGAADEETLQRLYADDAPYTQYNRFRPGESSAECRK